MKRAPENCTIADKVYDRDDPMRYEEGKCAGARTEELWGICERCKYYVYYEE